MSPKAPDKPARKSARKPAKVAEPRLEVTVAEDLSRATLTFLPASGVAGSLDLSLSQITTNVPSAMLATEGELWRPAVVELTWNSPPRAAPPLR